MADRGSGKNINNNSFAGKSLLLVEDDPMTAKVETLMLKKNGFSVKTVNCGEDAIQLFNEGEKFDLVLMDINLGSGMEGTAAAQKILARHDIPLIFLSSHTDWDVVSKTEGITSYGYIVKNSGEIVLIASIKMAFRLYYAKKREIENEKALVRNRYLLSEAARLSGLGTWELHFPEQDCFLSERFIQIHGIKETQITLNGLLGLFHPDDSERVRAIVQNAMEKITDFEFEARIAKQDDGNIRWVHWTGTVVAGDDGSLSRIYGATRDITRRKEIEDELRNEKDELDVIYKNTPVVMLLLNSDASVRKANTYASDFTGIPHNQLIGKRGGEILHCIEHINAPDGCGYGPHCMECNLRGAITDTIKNGTGYVKAEIPIISKEGNEFREITLRVSTSVLRHRGEDLCLAAIEDITEMKAAERAIRESEEKQNSFYHNIPVISHYVDEEGTIIDVTDSWLSEFGYEREEVIGKKSVDFLSGESRKYVIEKAFPEHLEKGITDYLPLQFVKKNGEIIDTLLSARAEYDREGKYLHSVAILINIAEINRDAVPVS